MLKISPTKIMGDFIVSQNFRSFFSIMYVRGVTKKLIHRWPKFKIKIEDLHFAKN